MHTIEARVAAINAEIAMMTLQMKVMEAEDREMIDAGLSPAHGPEQWEAFMKSWEVVLGSNAVTAFLKG